MAGVLDGVRIIELTTMVRPLAGMLLADLGASVIVRIQRQRSVPLFPRGLYGGTSSPIIATSAA
jgi:crotonobetainyl-CoA:carnitine CoA-transferase CaiB-like acyl-CoA transferase